MWILQYVAGYTLWDKKRIDEIRKQLGMRKLDKQIHERKKSWLQHLQRMPLGTACKQLLYCYPIG
jgi:hypothetical protein